jgi:cysteine-rich repeat protein
LFHVVTSFGWLALFTVDLILSCLRCTVLQQSSPMESKVSRRLTTCLFPPVPQDMPYKPEVKAALEAAVIGWLCDAGDAEVAYGHIKDWDTSLITDMESLFYIEGPSIFFDNAQAFNEDLSGWDVSLVTSFNKMFFNAPIAFDKDLSRWDVGKGTDFGQMFDGATAFSQTLCWDLSCATDSTCDIDGMFDGTAGATVADPSDPCFCGNGDLNIVSGETCDDSNTVGGDGCSATCQLEVQIEPGTPQPNEVSSGDATALTQGTLEQLSPEAIAAQEQLSDALPSAGTNANNIGDNAQTILDNLNPRKNPANKVNVTLTTKQLNKLQPEDYNPPWWVNNKKRGNGRGRRRTRTKGARRKRTRTRL